jgi:hypothetical protein
MQRQLRLGDVLDDYCPRERRLTNHVIVAMVGDEVKHTRCTTCDADHEYKHAKMPRQRRKTDTPAALFAQVAAGAPKRVTHEVDPVSALSEANDAPPDRSANHDARPADDETGPIAAAGESAEADGHAEEPKEEEGPAHRRLIRASLPRSEGQPPPSRPIPEFTIRQPAGRQNRFRPRPQGGGGQQFFGSNRSGGGNGGGPSRQARRDGPGPGGRRRPK